eukprot:2006334-Prymnesium_polylepis.1
MQSSPLRWLAHEELACIVGSVEDNDLFGLALACSALRDMVCLRCPRGRKTPHEGARFKTFPDGFEHSIAWLTWADASGCTFNAYTCGNAASEGRIE